MDVFRQRLEDEYNANVIITAPTVPYKGKCAVIYCRVKNNASIMQLYGETASPRSSATRPTSPMSAIPLSG